MQFDEPVLTEVVHSGDTKRRTFMCATLATRRDAGAELDLRRATVSTASWRDSKTSSHRAARLPRQLVETRGCAHHGDYQPLVPCFAAMHVDQLVLEYATPRAGELAVVGRALADREIGLGCVNPRTDEAESPETSSSRAEEALQFWKPEQIFLNPDCGFGCFANRCVNEEDIATAKLRSLVAAARELRENPPAPEVAL